MIHLKTSPASCPCCSKILDAAPQIPDNKLSSAGAIVLCIGCGSILKYNDALKLKEVKKEELENIKVVNIKSYNTVMHLSQYFKQQQQLVNP